MIRSQKMQLVSSGDDVDKVLEEASRFGYEAELSDKDTLRMRLLVEETMSMLRTMTGEVELELEFVRNDNELVIQLETDTAMDVLKKDELLSVSTSGRNVLAKGIMGKIRDVFATAFTMPEGGAWADYCATPMLLGTPGGAYSEAIMDTVYWSLAQYKSGVAVDTDNTEHKEAWDELEKSIVSNIADDVQIGVRGKHVVMAVIYFCKEF